ncbi:disease susceptibility protein LOV1-like [Magnolia sinica]|uniref:disease susceptibility protein LOV1-like n=1 Tax=Magnolia sinica TaxID=86752 RepID=UPI00265A89FB|nr:disease susceptibility protein LOV1-like [Magnolia sinica]
MIQLAKRSSSGGINSFRIHDLMHDLTKSLAEKGDFLSISVENLSRVTRLRRLAVHFHSNLAANPGISSISHLRSLLCFQMENQLLPFRKFKLLRVLELEGALITEWPKGIEKLIQLRYLGLRGTRLKRIPRSARNLRNLLTLDVKFTSIDKLPDAIREMKELRHLHANRYIVNSQIVESLINIQTLPMMQADAWMHEGLGELTNLRKLGISGDLSFCNKALSSLVKLRSLRVEFGLGNTILDLTSLSRNLVKLHLAMRLEKLPQVDQLPQNLVKLSLRWSLLEEDPFPTMERLQNLRTFILGRGSFVGKKMVCSREGFPKLDFLKLDFLNDLEEWRVEEGALPRLNHLVFQSCRRLKMLPEGLQHVTTLRMLEVSFMPDEFKARLQEDEGEDWRKIRHISQLDIK